MRCPDCGTTHGPDADEEACRCNICERSEKMNNKCMGCGMLIEHPGLCSTCWILKGLNKTSTASPNVQSNQDVMIAELNRLSLSLAESEKKAKALADALKAVDLCTAQQGYSSTGEIRSTISKALSLYAKDEVKNEIT